MKSLESKTARGVKEFQDQQKGDSASEEESEEESDEDDW